MANIKECEYPGCPNTFDIDNNEGVVETKFEGGKIHLHYYCCTEHKEEVE